jgi:outer membrane protein
MMKVCKNLLGAVLGLSVTSAMAADLGSYKDAPQEFVVEDERGWMIRGRAVGVFPDESLSGFTIPGAAISVDDAVMPEIDVTYFLSRNLALELAFTATHHDIDGEGALGLGGEVGDIWMGPATLMLQYHFDTWRGIKPYVGAGVNYTFFFNEDPGPAFTSLDLDDSFGFALQAGVDIPLRDNWYLNFDVKKLWTDTDASVSGGLATGNVELDPWVVGVGLGYRFPSWR